MSLFAFISYEGQPPQRHHHKAPTQDLDYISPEQYEFLQSEFMVPRSSENAVPLPEQEMIDILEGTNDLSNRVSDIKNRMELHRMLAEYEKQNRLMQAQPDTYSEVVNNGDEEEQQQPSDYEEIQAQQQPLFFQREFRRGPGSHFKERENEIVNGEKLQNLLNDLRQQDEEHQQQQQQQPENLHSTSFREVAKSEHIPTPQHFQMEDDIVPSFFNGKNHHRQMFDYEDTEANELPTVYLSPRDQLTNFRDESPEDGVYTEGGLVYVPGSSKNDATASLLQSIMGFTRHERLDVKKPGPQPPQPPPSSQSPHETPNLNLEQLPAHMKTDEQPKAKKQVHSDMDHSNFSVDTDYAHVILKNSIDSWAEGVSLK